MPPLAVDPEALDGAGSAVISIGEGLGSTLTTLTSSLAGCSRMSGDDPAGAAFGHSYDKSASKLLEAMTTTRNGLCRLGDGVRISARNYSIAEANSDISGRRHPLPGSQPTGAITAASIPSSVGCDRGAPAGWSWVSKYIGMIWPTGNSGKLRGAAAAWMSAGTNFEVSEITGTVGPMGCIAAQQIPEGQAIAAAFAETHRCAAAVLQQCAGIAGHLTSYASKIDTVHSAIVDLLARICNPLTGIKLIWDVLTDEDEHEIKRIANDIRIIVDQFTAEVDALRHQIARAITEATTILSTMTHYAEKEWDHFLRATDVGRAIDHFGRICGGVISGAESAVKGMWTLNPARAVVDPKGFFHSLSDALENLEDLTGIDGGQKAEEAWKDLGKNVVHWDEWAIDPWTAAGESLFDVGTLLLPGGPLSKLSAAGKVAAEAPRALHLPNPARLPHPAPHDNPPPKNEPPHGGQPTPAPKSGSALPPYGLTEPKTPGGGKPTTAPAPKPEIEQAAPGLRNPPSTTDDGGNSSHSRPPATDPTHPPGGGASGYAPQSPAPSHHGPVSNDPAPPAIAAITSSDLSALTDYTGLGHADLNDALRNGIVDSSQRARVDALNEALNKLPPYDGPVARGTDLSPDILARYQPGAAVTEPAFLSTSMNPAVPQSSAFAGNVEFRILSKTGRDISSYSLFPSEHEVLFPSGATFFVLDRRFDPGTGRTIIEMIEQ